MPETFESLSDLPIEVLCLSATPILIRNGQITSVEPGVFDVVLDNPEPSLNAGMRVVLAGGPKSTIRMNALVTDISENRLRVKTIRQIQPEKRAFPRLYGGLNVRYQVIEKKDEATAPAAWLAGDRRLSEKGVWHEPDPFMDFSSAGLKFEDRDTCQAGDILLLELKIPSVEEASHVTAQVVRVEPIPQDQIEETEGDEKESAVTHQIAIKFLAISDEAAEALASFTLKIQDALLRT